MNCYGVILISKNTIKVQVTKKGSTLITIPSFIASQLGLEKGSRVEWFLDGDRAILKKVSG